tara:strand:- start:937 stop:1701 length:765 start_codon:yes stop_codon:yes gene_type:complete
MDFKEVKGKKHYLYDSIREFRIHHPDETLNEQWRSGKEGDWVITDDYNVCQILKCYDLKIHGSKKLTRCVRTVIGTLRVDNLNANLLGEDGIAENIYTFSRTYKAFKEYKKAGLKPKEFVFAKYVAGGKDISKAYSKVFKKSKSSEYIANSANKLMKKDEVKKMVEEEIKNVLQEENVSHNWIISEYKSIVESSAVKDSDKLRSLDSLSKIAGLFNTETKKEQLTVWSGFTSEQMEALNDGSKTELIAHKEKEE